MHLALPPPKQPGQMAHAEEDGGVRSDSPRLCDGLAATAGQSVVGYWSVPKHPTPPPRQVKNADRPVQFKQRIPMARDSVRDSVIKA